VGRLAAANIQVRMLSVCVYYPINAAVDAVMTSISKRMFLAVALVILMPCVLVCVCG
jgi:hypothetical protein